MAKEKSFPYAKNANIKFMVKNTPPNTVCTGRGYRLSASEVPGAIRRAGNARRWVLQCAKEKNEITHKLDTTKTAPAISFGAVLLVTLRELSSIPSR